VEGTRIVAEAVARAPRRPRLVYASSLSVYGRTQHLPAPRLVTDPVDPVDPYGHTKAAAEEIVRGSGTDWVILRFAAVLPLRRHGGQGVRRALPGIAATQPARARPGRHHCGYPIALRPASASATRAFLPVYGSSRRRGHSGLAFGQWLSSQPRDLGWLLLTFEPGDRYHG